MVISDKLPLLKRQKALLIVSGDTSAKLYAIADGKLEERGTVAVQDAGQTDREGNFRIKVKGGGASPVRQAGGSGSTYEPKDGYLTVRFLKELAGMAQRIGSGDFIYLLAPRHMLEPVRKALAKTGERSVVREIAGNFVKYHPAKLLQKIAEPLKETPAIAREEVRKILRRPATA